jgi:hypothetical protein
MQGMVAEFTDRLAEHQIATQEGTRALLIAPCGFPLLTTRAE